MLHIPFFVFFFFWGDVRKNNRLWALLCTMVYDCVDTEQSRGTRHSLISTSAGERRLYGMSLRACCPTNPNGNLSYIHSIFIRPFLATHALIHNIHQLYILNGGGHRFRSMSLSVSISAHKTVQCWRRNCTPHYIIGEPGILPPLSVSVCLCNSHQYLFFVLRVCDLHFL